MPQADAVVVLAHGGWADGSSWNKVIAGLRAEGVKAVAAPLPMTTLADDVAMLDHILERVPGPVVAAAHAYVGAVIASTSVRTAPADHVPMVTKPSAVVDILLEAVREVEGKENSHG
jgi:pimeloyl-ACP methyl ester carboxylesterase